MCPNSARQNRDTARRFHWRLWHIKSPDLPKAVSQSLRIQLALNSAIIMPVSLVALAPGMPNLTQGPEPKPPNSVPSSKARTGVQSQNSANAEFWSFCIGLLVKQELPDAKAPLSLIFDYFSKVDFAAFLKA